MKIDKIVQKQKETIEGLLKELSIDYAVREADELKITGEMKCIMKLIKMHQKTLEILCPTKKTSKANLIPVVEGSRT